MNELNKELVRIVKESFQFLQSCVDNSKSILYRNDNRLYIPTSSNSKLRISEQELKFVFRKVSC